MWEGREVLNNEMEFFSDLEVVDLVRMKTIQKKVLMGISGTIFAPLPS